MILRVVRTVIAPGREADYWAWSAEILALWDEAGIRRAGGPYSMRAPGGEEVGVWLTVHESEEQARSEFQSLYAEGRGSDLIALRPPLVASTTTDLAVDWDPSSGPPPPPPSWLPPAP